MTPKPLSSRLAEWEADQRAKWQDADTPLTFEAWQGEQVAKANAENEARMKAEWLAEQRAARIQARENQTPNRYRSAEMSDEQVKAWCDHLVPQNLDQPIKGNVRGPSLLLLGATGRGKTHEAFGALRYLVEAGLPNTIKAVVAADLYAQLRPRTGVDSEEEFEKVARVGMLFVDDLGAAKSSEWVEEINYRLINHRYNHELPTLFTSNVPPRELASVLGERVASRLTEMCQTVVLKGQDRRRAAA